LSDELAVPGDDKPEPRRPPLPSPATPIDPDQARVIAQFVRQEITQDIKHEIHQHWAEDLPPADDLIRLEQASPGAIERVLNHMDREQENRDRLNHRAAAYDERRLEASVTFHQTAQWILGVIAIIAIGGGIAVILTGHSAVGLAAILSALAVLALAFIWGRTTGGGDTKPGPEDDGSSDEP